MNWAGTRLRCVVLCVVFSAALIGRSGAASAEEPAAPPADVQLLLDRLARHDTLDDAETRNLEHWAKETAERLSRGDAAGPRPTAADDRLSCPAVRSLPSAAEDIASVLAGAERRGDAVDEMTRNRLDRLTGAGTAPGIGSDVGAILVLTGAASSAVYLAGRSLAADPGDAVAANNLALALAAAGDAGGAAAALAYAVSLEPDNAAILGNQGWTLFAAGDSAAAGPVLEHALALDPGQPAALAGTAAVALCAGSLSLAAETAARTLDQAYIPAAARILQAAAIKGIHPSPAGGALDVDWGPSDAALSEVTLPVRFRDFLGAHSQIAGAAADLEQERLSYATAENSLGETLQDHGVDLARRGRRAGGTRDGHTLTYPVGDDRPLTALARLKIQFDQQASAARAVFDRALPRPAEAKAANFRSDACSAGSAAFDGEQAAFMSAWTTYWTTRRQLLGRYLAATAPSLRGLHDGQIDQFFNLMRTTTVLGTYADALDLANGWLMALEPPAGTLARCPAGPPFTVTLPKILVVHGQPCAADGFILDLQVLKLAADCQSVRITFAGDAAGIEEHLPLDGIPLEVRLSVYTGAEKLAAGGAAVPFVTFDGRRAVDEGGGPAPATRSRLLLSAFWRDSVPRTGTGILGTDQAAAAAAAP